LPVGEPQSPLRHSDLVLRVRWIRIPLGDQVRHRLAEVLAVLELTAEVGLHVLGQVGVGAEVDAERSVKADVDGEAMGDLRGDGR